MRGSAHQQHRDDCEHPPGKLARTIHLAIQASTPDRTCQPGQCAYIAAQLLAAGWSLDPQPTPIIARPRKRTP